MAVTWLLLSVQVMKLLKGVPPTPPGEEPAEEDPDGFLILDMFDEALQDTAKRVGEDVENPDETALLSTINRNGLSDRVVPRVFTNGIDVILKQANEDSSSGRRRR